MLYTVPSTILTFWLTISQNNMQGLFQHFALGGGGQIPIARILGGSSRANMIIITERIVYHAWTRGVWGHAPPRNFFVLHPQRQY